MELLWPIGSLLDLDNLLQMVFRIFAALTRARELIWGPVFGHFPEKCERFLNFCNFTFKKCQVQSLTFLSNNTGAALPNCESLTFERRDTTDKGTRRLQKNNNGKRKKGSPSGRRASRTARL